ncbi:DUF2791 family P-loop domain-containing protein, partial [Brevibacillus borstelensis]|uniref:BREX system ATP-binding domain-containing protein n=1 Tax=Brevibacillus borstelensis TaxID=45462 RepID=UPI002E1AB60B|nr:DUF2791 family P-loop domain-containing protein [Brevibacillus borstelensis]
FSVADPTPEFLEDERRGLFSYGALKRRLESNQFETIEYRDLSQPVIKLTPLKNEETFVLLQKIKDIHAVHFEYQTEITESDIMGFIQTLYLRPGAEDNLTAGDIVRQFIGALNVLHQNPTFDKMQIFGIPDNQTINSKSSVHSRFQKTSL